MGSGFRVSEEADRKGLELARSEGNALSRTVAHMIADIAETGYEQPAGEYLIACAVEKAEGLYRFREGQLEWEEPRTENAHIEIVVRDAADGRFVPNLPVEVTVTTRDGRRIASRAHPFLWHPYLYHYGANWEIPGDGEYNLRVHIGVPNFARHDKENGRRYTQSVDVEFARVKIRTGRG